MSTLDDRLYALYRQRLHRTHGKPLRKQRNVHKLERALVVWPLHAYAWWVQRRSKYSANTTLEQKEDA